MQVWTIQIMTLAFLCQILSIELRVADSDVVIWHNKRSSSTRFCRPIKFEFKRETTEVIKEEVEEIESQIRSIIPSKCDNGITVNHTMVMTMVKICNAVTDTTSTMRCYICNITSKDINNLQYVYSIPTKNENLKFGISPLHMREYGAWNVYYILDIIFLLRNGKQ